MAQWSTVSKSKSATNISAFKTTQLATDFGAFESYWAAIKHAVTISQANAKAVHQTYCDPDEHAEALSV